MLIRIGCSVSSVVGFVCYALSSTFIHLFGKWSWWKISIYVVVSFIICLAILFAKAWQGSTGLRQKVQLAFWVLIITTVYSFFMEKVMKVKPDAYSLISSASFAIMLLDLSKDLLLFFCASLITQLVWIKFWLLTVGMVFSYSLIHLHYYLEVRSPEIFSVSLITELMRLLRDRVDFSYFHGLRYYLMHSPAIERLERVDSGTVAIDMPPAPRHGSDSVENSNASASASASAIHVDSAQANTDVHLTLPPEANFGCDSDVVLENRDSRSQDQDPCVVTPADSPSHEANSYRTKLMTSIEELKKRNQDIIGMIRGPTEGPELSEERIQQLEQDQNLVTDGLPSRTISELQEAMELMVKIGFEEECSKAYSSWRREFLVECLSTFGLEKFDMVEEVKSWIKASNLALKILFPNEERLCQRIFRNCSSLAGYDSIMEVCRDLTIRLLQFPITLTTASHSPNLSPDLILKMDNTLSGLISRFKFPYYGNIENTLTKDARAVLKMLNIFKNCYYSINRDKNKVIVPSGGLHPVTPAVMSKLARNFGANDTYIYVKSIKVADIEGNSLLSRLITCIMEKLESNLETKSRNNTNLALCCLSRMNNLRYMEELAKQCGLITILVDGWLENIRAKVQQNLGDYLSNSWNELLNYLELDNNETKEAMKEKLNSFNHRFQDICYLQSEWFVFDEKLREKIMKSIENMLVVPYGIYVGRFRDAAGKSAHNHIKYGILDIQNQLCNMLFHESNGKNRTVEEEERTLEQLWNLYKK